MEKLFIWDMFIHGGHIGRNAATMISLDKKTQKKGKQSEGIYKDMLLVFQHQLMGYW